MTHDVPSAAGLYIAEDADAGTRLDRFLASRIETLSRARLQDLIRSGHVAGAAGPLRDPSSKVRGGDRIEVSLPEVKFYEVPAEPMALTILYEDSSIVVLDKPAGLAVHPGAGNTGGTLVNALLAHCGGSLSGIGGVARPGIVHRLDKDTSGVMAVAKTDAAHRGLAAQFADHGRTRHLRRDYLALVWGAPRQPAGRIETLIGRDPASRIKMAVVPAGGRSAITHYRVKHIFGSKRSMEREKQRWNNSAAASLIRCSLETGRTHQVRVHMAHLGHPIVGDRVYGAGFRSKALTVEGQAGEALARMGRQALHAVSLQIEHPESGKLLSFESPLPPDIAELCNGLETLETKLSKN